MAVNRGQFVEVRRNFAFIQQSIAFGELETVAAYLLQNDLITREKYYDVLAPCGRGPTFKAAMLTSSVDF